MGELSTSRGIYILSTYITHKQVSSTWHHLVRLKLGSQQRTGSSWTCTMVRCCCVVISLCITHALGCETSGFQALPRGDQDCLRHRDKQRWEGSWTGDNTGLSRARGGLRSVRAVGLGISYRGRKTHSGDSSWISGKRDARDSANVLEAARRIARWE